MTRSTKTPTSATEKSTLRTAARTKGVQLPYALRSFIGHLEGTQKAAHTIGSYKSDLATFQNFLQTGLGSKPVKLEHIGPKDLATYQDYLSAMGLKTNTRRRKLLTVRRFLKYLAKRKKLSIDPSSQLPAPYKVERVPFTVPTINLLKIIETLPTTTLLEMRNRVLLQTLAETGSQVSEVARLRFENFEQDPASPAPTVYIAGKASRRVPISSELLFLVSALKKMARDNSPFLFLGFNKFGPMGAAISPRGVELLVRHYAAQLQVPELTPRTFRHSVVVHWHQQGVARDEIQRRLGLRTAYAFRVYQPILRRTTVVES